MTEQEIYDKAVFGVVNQGKASLNGQTGWCAYRGPNNTKCGVGHLIEDDDFARELDRRDAAVFNWREDDWERSGLSEEHRLLLTAIQQAHDNASHNNDFIGQFKHQANDVAHHFGLKARFA